MNRGGVFLIFLFVSCFFSSCNEVSPENSSIDFKVNNEDSIKIPLDTTTIYSFSKNDFLI